MIPAFDKLVNDFITPTSVTAGVGTVFLSFFTGKIAPKMPNKFYKLLDNNLIRIVIVSFLVNQQIHQPSLSVLFGIGMVLGFDLLVKIFAPDTPPLSELVKPAEEETKSSSSGGCNCYCGNVINTSSPPPGSKIQSKNGNRNNTLLNENNKWGGNDRSYSRRFGAFDTSGGMYSTI